jgi:hypothetical protein
MSSAGRECRECEKAGENFDGHLDACLHTTYVNQSTLTHMLRGEFLSRMEHGRDVICASQARGSVNRTNKSRSALLANMATSRGHILAVVPNCSIVLYRIGRRGK